MRSVPALQEVPVIRQRPAACASRGVRSITERGQCLRCKGVPAVGRRTAAGASRGGRECSNEIWKEAPSCASGMGSHSAGLAHLLCAAALKAACWVQCISAPLQLRTQRRNILTRCSPLLCALGRKMCALLQSEGRCWTGAIVGAPASRGHTLLHPAPPLHRAIT